MSCSVNYILTLQGRRLNSSTMQDAYKTRGGNLFEICSRSVGDYVFKELFEDGNVVRREGGVIISSKQYSFKTVMERFMLKGAVKVVRPRSKNQSDLCQTMKQWFLFMNLMDEKEKEHDELCRYTVLNREIVAYSRSISIIYSFKANTAVDS